MTGLIEARASTIAISSTVASSLPAITSRVTASTATSAVGIKCDALSIAAKETGRRFSRPRLSFFPSGRCKVESAIHDNF